MRTMTKKNKVLATAGALALVAGGGGAAYAYWTTTGSGSGTATNATANGTLALTATFAAGLAPGNEASVAYTAANTNTTGSRVGALTATVSTSDPTNCKASWFEVTAVTSNSLVAAGASNVSVGSGVLKFNNSDENQDACKGAVVTITVGSV
ncbi:hypothetical protein ACRB8A_16190 [Arthrobacter sp. G.S.26]|uniref:hypothetical protein n=1 Tax=Micrococcaceae TaxID=1268 RepID=UPI0025523647|nr:hypothetical protein [Pseudarthrobacter sp. MEB009]